MNGKFLSALSGMALIISLSPVQAADEATVIAIPADNLPSEINIVSQTENLFPIEMLEGMSVEQMQVLTEQEMMDSTGTHRRHRRYSRYSRH